MAERSDSDEAPNSALMGFDPPPSLASGPKMTSMEFRLA